MFTLFRNVLSTVCNVQGEIDVQSDWYGFPSKFIYSRGDQVEFDYNITYSLQHSYENPIILVLYKEQLPAVSICSVCLYSFHYKSDMFSLHATEHWLSVCCLLTRTYNKQQWICRI